MNRLLNMALRMLFRQGLRRMTQGQKPDPNVRRAAKTMRSVNRIRKL